MAKLRRVVARSGWNSMADVIALHSLHKALLCVALWAVHRCFRGRRPSAGQRSGLFSGKPSLALPLHRDDNSSLPKRIFAPFLQRNSKSSEPQQVLLVPISTRPSCRRAIPAACTGAPVIDHGLVYTVNPLHVNQRLSLLLCRRRNRPRFESSRQL